MEITLRNLQKNIPIPRSRILKAAKRACRKLVREIRVLSVVFVGPTRMRTINRKYLKHDFATDVLTFELGAGMGELIICPHIARANAKSHRTSTGKELVLYVIHGILHLAGFDDKTEEGKTAMRRIENKLLT